MFWGSARVTMPSSIATEDPMASRHQGELRLVGVHDGRTATEIVCRVLGLAFAPPRSRSRGDR